MIDPSSFFDTKINSKPISSYNQGYLAYELLYMSMSSEEPQKELSEVAEKLKNSDISQNNIRNVIYDHKSFDDYRKIYMEAADQNRKIMNNTFNTFKCKFCKSSKVLSNVVQERGLDEPSTVYIKCLACGKTYKEAE